MSLPWVKVHVSVLDNDVFQGLSANARLTFLISIPLAQKLGQGGKLATRLAPLTISQLQKYTGLSANLQANALDELAVSKFFEGSEAIGYTVARFIEFQGASSNERVKRHRSTKSTECNVTVTLPKRYEPVTEALLKPECNALDIDREGDKDKDLASLVARDESREFNDWFVDVGLEVGAIPAHFKLFPREVSIRLSTTVTKRLLDTYPRAEVETRSRRLLAAIADRRIRRSATTDTLSDCWQWDAVSGETSVPALNVVPPRRYPGFVVISFEDNTYWRYDGPDRPVGWADTLPRGGTILPKPLAIVDGAAVAR